jgi:hypothetical protein
MQEMPAYVHKWCREFGGDEHDGQDIPWAEARWHGKGGKEIWGVVRWKGALPLLHRANARH